MPRFGRQPEPVVEEPRQPDELNEYDRREIRRLILVTRPGEHSGRRREAWIITLESGKEVVLVIPVDVASALGKQDGYVGRIRPARADDHVQIQQPPTRGSGGNAATQ